jgi:hypothetical protein
MQILKLDGRFANYPRYKYALQFRGRTVRAVAFCTERKEYAKIFEKFYGPARIKNPDFDAEKSRWLGQYMDNPQWMFDKKHNRIYYQDESVLSMVMLMIPTVA